MYVCMYESFIQIYSLALTLLNFSVKTDPDNQNNLLFLKEFYIFMHSLDSHWGSVACFKQVQSRRCLW